MDRWQYATACAGAPVGTAIRCAPQFSKEKPLALSSTRVACEFLLLALHDSFFFLRITSLYLFIIFIKKIYKKDLDFEVHTKSEKLFIIFIKKLNRLCSLKLIS
jgi:hypothetical protein